jgi:quercetin dioxygenase-like cupin family protein
MKRIIPAVLISGLMAVTPYLIAQVETPTEPTNTPSTEPTKEATTAPMKESSPEATPEETKAPAKPKSEMSAPAATATMFTPRDLKWTEGVEGFPAGIKVAKLEGDPKKKGSFTIRIEVPNGYKVPPHTHPATEHLTVVDGTFYLAMGDKFDEKAGQKLPKGSFAVVPARAKHFAWAKGKAVLQIQGNGPWEVTYVNPADDPRRMSAQKKEKPAVKKP